MYYIIIIWLHFNIKCNFLNNYEIIYIPYRISNIGYPVGQRLILIEFTFSVQLSQY